MLPDIVVQPTILSGWLAIAYLVQTFGACWLIHRQRRRIRYLERFIDEQNEYDNTSPFTGG